MGNKLLHIRVTPRAKKELIKKVGDELKIYVNAPAVDGRANVSAVRLLAKYLDVKASQIEIIKGDKSRNKIVRII
ncbi:MAG: hypothetical protein COU81_01350 [Candidatus Portnoybacteria bacterium CG10_big_fil_rev_8_21_14_0_10_36_7]|uniref:UPF0235 protein COU81_01350 n=1 Tax=Candidatus Portnoybacteria bacterium CG10_big_fil_rev_8_21_14_0_10_36_7 TaxID=1974812 RepID=A0A2M8KEG5_9BACT|nr:MAG: hypothetical protein COU81_01350 [Candidatus Portnoybacteria bacterium CG10_big_fil_rev_8_21_14_0_10_36_7]